MPQFVVPQFIDVEDKIIGPITVRQFIMGVVVLFGIFLSFKLADTALFILETVLLIGFYVLVAFVKVNGQPFYYFLLSIFRSLKRPALRLWSREATNLYTMPIHTESIKNNIAPVVRKKLVQRELSSLSLLVDTGGHYRPEEILNKNKRTEEK